MKNASGKESDHRPTSTHAQLDVLLVVGQPKDVFSRRSCGYSEFDPKVQTVWLSASASGRSEQQVNIARQSMSRRWSIVVGAALFAVGAIGTAAWLWGKRRQLALAAAKAVPGQAAAAATEQASAVAGVIPEQASAVASAIPEQASGAANAMTEQPSSAVEDFKRLKP
jgi:hypothetical protein